MAGSVNKVILIGNLGKDPEIRHMPDGTKVAGFSIATSEIWKDKMTGERREKTEWHRITVINERLCEIIEKYLRKGSKVYLEGQLQTRKWTDQSGNERVTTEVLLGRYRGELTLLDSKSSQNDDFALGDPLSSFSNTKTSEPHTSGFQNKPSPVTTLDDLDDETPF